MEGKVDVSKLLTLAIGGFVKRYCIGGFDIPSVLHTGRRYVESGYQVSYDLMLEDLETSFEVKRARAVLGKLARRMDTSNTGNIVVKPSMCGLSLKTDIPGVADRMFKKYLRDLISLVFQQSPAGKMEVEVDAESSAQLKRKLAVILELQGSLPKEWVNRLRVAVQMHLSDLPEYAETYKIFEQPVRIVKGAGVYKEDLAKVVDGDEIRRRALQYSYEAICNNKRPYVATVRDREYARALLHDFRCLGITKDKFEIQMLHGIGFDLARELHDEGYSVRIYIPFVMPWCKDAWKPYIARRITTLASAWLGEYARRFRFKGRTIG